MIKVDFNIFHLIVFIKRQKFIAYFDGQQNIAFFQCSSAMNEEILAHLSKEIAQQKLDGGAYPSLFLVCAHPGSDSIVVVPNGSQP